MVKALAHEAARIEGDKAGRSQLAPDRREEVRDGTLVGRVAGVAFSFGAQLTEQSGERSSVAPCYGNPHACARKTPRERRTEPRPGAYHDRNIGIGHVHPLSE